MIALLLLAACGPDTGDTTLDLECEDGFGRRGDYCYPLDLDTGGDEPMWAYAEAACEGEAPQVVTIQTPGPLVSLWGAFSPELLNLCEYEARECPGIDGGATGTEVEPEGVGDGVVVVRCERFEGYVVETESGEEVLSGYRYSPVRAYFLAD